MSNDTSWILSSHFLLFGNIDLSKKKMRSAKPN